MQLTQHIAVTLLAATDALFIPDRDPSARPRHQALGERRRAFPDAGIPWASERVAPGLDEAGRKEVQRALEDLVGQGVVETFRPNGAKTLGARLTDKGDASTRALCGVPTLTTTIPTLEALECAGAGPDAVAFMGQTWVPETALAGVAWGDHERQSQLVMLEHRLLPGLAGGFVRSNCSVRGHCWYSLDPDWRKRLPSESPALPEKNDLAHREYLERLKEALRALWSCPPEHEREIGEIPMPVSSPRTGCG